VIRNQLSRAETMSSFIFGRKERKVHLGVLVEVAFGQ
jgi:hypothetical protein